MNAATEPLPATGRLVSSKIVLTWLGAAVGSIVAVLIVAAIGKALGAPDENQLAPGPLIFFTVIGTAVGTVAWVLLTRRAADPGRLLSRLVPAVLVLSFVPDVLLGVGGTAWSAVVTLMGAHLAIFAVTIPVLVKRLGLRAIV